MGRIRDTGELNEVEEKLEKRQRGGYFKKNRGQEGVGKENFL